MIIVAVWQEIEEVNDPTFSYKLDTEHFYVRNQIWFLSKRDLHIFF